mmetsp:Transcript_112016/g.222639  ORF Transcript_112016/g.222639 Transcript_112016/m.222639 type:complete len:205 (+) Transcript_112016:858-1472(+)
MQDCDLLPRVAKTERCRCPSYQTGRKNHHACHWRRSKRLQHDHECRCGCRYPRCRRSPGLQRVRLWHLPVSLPSILAACAWALVLPADCNFDLLYLLQKHCGCLAAVLLWCGVRFLRPETVQRYPVPDLQRSDLHGAHHALWHPRPGCFKEGLLTPSGALHCWNREGVSEHPGCIHLDAERPVACSGCLLYPLLHHGRWQHSAP